jgi:hypothetical protein
VTLLDQLAGPWEYVTLWPTLGPAALGPLTLVAAVVVSVLIGTGRLWPGSGPDRSTFARLVLLGLNVFAVLVPLSFTVDGSGQDPWVYAQPVRTWQGDDALRQGDQVIRNIYAYDANGQPLSGVQLFDQYGRPVEVSPWTGLGRGAQRQVTCPWFNGAQELFNVYPLPQRQQRDGSCLQDRPAGTYAEPAPQAPPLAAVPPATMVPQVPAE